MGHWYRSEDGQPLYTVPKADGKGERDTTLRDARKLNLVPSVTTILGIVDKPALTRWKINEVLEAVLGDIVDPYYERMDYFNEEECSDWKAYILRRSEKKGKDAANRGNEIHNTLEHYYTHGNIDIQMYAYCQPVIDLISSKFGKMCNWVPEASFSHVLGFGGKCDLHMQPCGDFPNGVIIDFKTKSAEDFSKVRAYPEQCQQLVAYREGFGIPKADCYNLFIGTNSPDKLLLHKWEEKECVSAWKCFTHLVEYWKEINHFVLDK